MYAYIDETGNTGGNIFDKAQPLFITAALITKTNFDLLYAKKIKDISLYIGQSYLHANQLSIDIIDKVAIELLNIFIKCNSRFFISSIEKKYLVASKFVDTIFDPFENKAVPWHIYNIRPLRLQTVLQINSIFTEDAAKLFWGAILAKNRIIGTNYLLESLNILKTKTLSFSDPRTRQVIADALDFAIENTEAILFHSNTNAIRKGHFPNLAILPNLLEGIEFYSKKWNRGVKEITHDTQGQFQNALTDWHDLYSNASPGAVNWLDEKYILRRVPNSKFTIKRSQDSAGLQVIDIILWLYKRFSEEKHLTTNCSSLMKYVFRHGHQNKMTFEEIHIWLKKYFTELNSKTLTEKQIKDGKRYFDYMEEQRLETIKKYIKKN